MRNNPFRAVLVAAALWVSLQTQAFSQQPVAKVVEIDGPKMTYERKATVAAAFPFMDTMIKDEYVTDGSTVAAIEFVTGGRVGINKNTKIEVVSESAVTENGKPLVKRLKVKSGRILAKISKRKDPLEIETAGGVMGIKGTEFEVSVADSGATSLRLVEGTIEITPASGGTPFLIEGPAAWQTLEDGKALPVKKYESEDQLRDEIIDSPEWADFQKAINIVNTISNYAYIPGQFGLGTASQAFYYVGTASNFVTNPEQAAIDLAASYVPGGGFMSYIPRNNKPPEPDFPTNPSPAQNAAVSSPPTFTWTGTKDAEGGYLLMVSKDEKMEALEWAAKVKQGTSVTYPTDATPLAPGLYYWRVMGLNDEGKPIGKATQSTFQSQGWGASATPATP